ncbi:MAG: hypothetical protein CMO55_07060 [Verrucomicrobiales bacterium]|nr:hypothetical protein [Verrucomicrobiales bacterium]
MYKLVPHITAAAFLCIFSSSLRADDNSKPIGWEEMDEARKQEFLDLNESFRSALKAIKITEEEKAALSAGEKKAHYQAMWELRRGYHDDLEENGFEFKSYTDIAAEAAVKMNNSNGSGSGGSESISSAINGTIVYDSDFPTTAFGNGTGQIIGNRFDTFSSGFPVCNPGTVSTIRALVVPGAANTTSSAGFVLLGPQTSMGGAQAIFSTFGAATGVIDSVSFAGLGVTYTGSSFFVLFGDFDNSYLPVFGPGTTKGQGHHAVVGYTGGMGPNITSTTPIAGMNGFIRASGVILTDTPVELMKFEVESDSNGGESSGPPSE